MKLAIRLASSPVRKFISCYDWSIWIESFLFGSVAWYWIRRDHKQAKLYIKWLYSNAILSSLSYYLSIRWQPLFWVRAMKSRTKWKNRAKRKAQRMLNRTYCDLQVMIKYKIKVHLGFHDFLKQFFFSFFSGKFVIYFVYVSTSLNFTLMVYLLTALLENGVVLDKKN